MLKHSKENKYESVPISPSYLQFDFLLKTQLMIYVPISRQADISNVFILHCLYICIRTIQ